jgi:hypothetical protein
MSKLSNITEQEYKQIEELIGSDESVVGIDAKKTHILILHMLKKLDDRLSRIEEKLESRDK